MPTREDFISAYLDYIGDTEAPITFHRWSCLAILGSWLGKRYQFQFGHSDIACNLYVMLMGGAGSRKSTAIKIAVKLLRNAGYNTIAAERSSKEKFLMDLAGEGIDEGEVDIMEQNLFGKPDRIAEILIGADEFNVFVGNGNIEFLSLLGTLWDWKGPFEDRKKNSKSLIIGDPCVSILAGNTATGFSLAFPSEAIGQGIFSRLLLVHGDKTDRKIAFPDPPDISKEANLVRYLQEIRITCTGLASIEARAKSLLSAIYEGWTGSTMDIRFESYSNRRFSQLIKLSLLCSAAALRNTIIESDVIYANTMLVNAEHSMPKALGEFGKSKNSDVSNKIMQLLAGTYTPMPLKDLWKHVHNDLKDMSEMKDLLNNLYQADKILSHKTGWLIKRAVLEENSNSTVDFSLLSEEERKYIC